MKTWYLSKTLWVNLLALIALVLQNRYGFVFDGETQAALLGFINIVLRMATNQPLDWKNDPNADQAGYIKSQLLHCLLLAAILITLVITSSCATMAPGPPAATDTTLAKAGKSLLITKATIVTTASAINSLCQAQQLPLETCQTAKALYEQSRPLYDAAVDSYLLLSQGGDPARFEQTLTRLSTIAITMQQLAGGAK